MKKKMEFRSGGAFREDRPITTPLELFRYVRIVKSYWGGGRTRETYYIRVGGTSTFWFGPVSVIRCVLPNIVSSCSSSQYVTKYSSLSVRQRVIKLIVCFGIGTRELLN